MNKTLSILTAVMLVFALLLCACGKEKTPAPSAVGETVAEPAASEETAGRELSLTDCDLSISGRNGADNVTVQLKAVPSDHAKKDTATFAVRLEGEEVISTSCDWKDGAYVASVDLEAADGYCYYVILSGADGAFAEIAVNTPAEPINESLINLASAMEAYCTLILEETSLVGVQLEIFGGTAVVQAPRITDDNENVACAQATLVLTLDGEEVGSKALTMAPGAAERSYEASLSGVSFTLPLPGEIGADQQLTLRLDAVLTNGLTLTAEGGSWYYLDGVVANAVG